MTTNRARPDAGFCNFKKLPRGPDGRACCRYCGVQVPVGRKSFCGDICVHEWKIRANPGYARSCCWKRDHGVCALCGKVDSGWEADHIVPVVEGGGECGLSGYRTLCHGCHVNATNALRLRRMQARKQSKAL